MNQNISTIKCPKCNAAIPKTLSTVKIVGCPACGSYSVMGEDGILLHEKKFVAINRNQQALFFLGEKFDYQNVKYTVNSIYCYKVTYEEWDSNNKKWAIGSGKITEWYAQKDNNRWVAVMRDVDKKYYFIDELTKVKGVKSYENDLTEFGKFSLHSFIGVDDEPLEVTGHYRCYNDYIFESEKENFTDGDCKFYKIRKLTSSQIKRMKIIGSTLKMEAAEKFESVSFYRNLFALAFFAILCLFFLDSDQNTEGVQRGNLVRFEKQPNIITYKTMYNDMDTTHLKPQFAGVFKLDANKNYEFRAIGFIPTENQDADFSISIVRQEDKEVVEEVMVDFFRESGRDDEGRWEESVLEDKFKFQTDKTGNYEVYVSPDYDALWDLRESAMTVEISNTSFNSFYVMLGSFLFLTTLIFQWQRESLAAYANLDYSTTLHDFFDRFG